MADTENKSETPVQEKKADKSSHPQFLEVKCESSGKTRRFAEGTESKFALRVINSKLESGIPLALCIAAVKHGEEPVVFGPSATLTNYGHGWKLQTLTSVHGEDDAAAEAKKTPATKKAAKKAKNEIIKLSVLASYVGKILLVFAFMFILGGALSYFLVVLPDYIEYLNKYWNQHAEPITASI